MKEEEKKDRRKKEREKKARMEQGKKKVRGRSYGVTSSMMESGPSRSLVPTCILSVSRPRIASKSGAEF